MMTQAFYSGISGLQNSSFAIDTISDNLANVSTVGYRSYTSEFASLFEDSLSMTAGLSESVGLGVRVNGTSMSTEQGSLKLSDSNTDLAIEGDGWFGVASGEDAYYTRNGAFTFDTNSDLVTTDGYYVLGTMGGNISADDTLIEQLDAITLSSVNQQEKLRFPNTLTYPAIATTEASFVANLGIGEEGNETVTVGANVIDSQSNENSLRLAFTKNGVQTSPGSQWSVTATVTSADGETLYSTQSGEVSFDASGALISNTLTSIDNNGTEVSIDLGSGYDGVVSIDIPVVSGSSTANGVTSGDLVGYAINENAEVIATFSNGMQSSVGKIAVYQFANDEGLARVSGTRFQESANSGEASFYTDANGNVLSTPSVANFVLESSNVDLSDSLTNLIIYQRAYDANSKSVTTADEMMQKALNMDA